MALATELRGRRKWNFKHGDASDGAAVSATERQLQIASRLNKWTNGNQKEHTGVKAKALHLCYIQDQVWLAIRAYVSK